MSGMPRPSLFLLLVSASSLLAGCGGSGPAETSWRKLAGTGGRGLPVLKRILGRTRNMLHRPDGTTFWPTTGSNRCRKIAPVAQMQLVQTSLETVEARIVPDGPMTNEHRRDLLAHYRNALRYPFQIELVFVDEIPRSKSGKWEEFVSLVTPSG